MTQTVIGIFNSEAEAQRAVQELMNDGFTDANVDYSSGFSGDSRISDTTYESKENETGVERFFKNLFGDDDNDQVNKYSSVAKKSNFLVTVHAQSEDEAERAADILDLYGAIDVDQKATEYGFSTGSDYNTSDSEFRSYDRDNLTEDRSIPVVEEDFEVGKREVETGGVRLRSRIIERPVEENVRLRQEKVWVERNAVNRPATEADFREEEVVMTEHGERAVVSKDARIVEEVRLGKEVDERTETVRDTVRKTEVDVENFNQSNPRINE